MKRCLSIALILALTGAVTLSPAVAEEAEIVSGNIEAEVAPAELTGELGLFTDDADFDIPAEEALGLELETVSDEYDEAAFEAEVPEDADEALTADEAEEEFLDEAALATSKQTAPDADAASIRLSASSLTLGLEETYTGLTAAVETDGSVPAIVTWRSDNKKYVVVDAETGAVTGVKRGSANIYAALPNGQEARCKVTVKKAPTKITFDPDTLKLSAGGMSVRLNASVTSDHASAKLTYSSDHPEVAAVDENGVVTGVAAGTATITVKTYNGKKDTCKVTVADAPASLAFAADSLSLGVGQELSVPAVARTVKGDVTPAAVTYSIDPASADPECVTVDAAGKVHAARKGQAVLVAVTHNGIVARCALTVAAAPKSVQLNHSSGTIGVKEVYTGLRAELVAPADETTAGGGVTWSSSNKKIATVDAATGAITGVAKGTVTITATAFNGKKASCKVTVKKAPGSVSISPASASLTVGETGQYKISFSNSSYGGGVTFSSSNPEVASVDEDGLVTALSAGTATITVTTYNKKTAKSTLVVKGASQTPPEDSGDVASVVDKYNSGMTDAEKLEYVIYVAQSKLGKPYVYGSFGPNSFDCSGFTTYCFRQINVELKHSAYTQGYDESQTQLTMSELKRGDLVFFDTVNDSDLSDHAGIYLGGGKFIHASSSAGKVIVSTLSSGYYNRVFSWGRRVFD